MVCIHLFFVVAMYVGTRYSVDSRYVLIAPFYPFGTAVPFWGQTTEIVSTSSPKRDCSIERVQGTPRLRKGCIRGTPSFCPPFLPRKYVCKGRVPSLMRDLWYLCMGPPIPNALLAGFLESGLVSWATCRTDIFLPRHRLFCVNPSSRPHQRQAATARTRGGGGGTENVSGSRRSPRSGGGNGRGGGGGERGAGGGRAGRRLAERFPERKTRTRVSMMKANVSASNVEADTVRFLLTTIR